MSIESEITTLTTDRNSIRTALANKGVSAASSHGFDDFAGDITDIPSSTASIIVTTTGGSVITDCTATTPRGITLQGVQVGSTWTFSNLSVFGTYTVSYTNGTDTGTVSVTVDEVGQFNVTVGFRTYLYNEGDECTSLTGGWSKVKIYSYTQDSPVKNSDSITLSCSNYWHECAIATVNPIDVSNYSKIGINITAHVFVDTGYDNLVLTTTRGSATFTANKRVGGGIGEFTANIPSGTTTLQYAAFYMTSGNEGAINMTFNKIWLE